MKKRYAFVFIILCILLFSVLFLLMFFIPSHNNEKETVILEYWTHEDPSRQLLEDRLIAEFEKQHPTIKIERKYYSSSELLRVLPTAFDVGRGPTMFSIQQDYVSSLLYGNKLAPVDIEAVGYTSQEALVDAYISGTFEDCSKDGVVYGMPMEFTNWCLYVNKNIFREAGLDPEKDYPRTWEDMVRVSELLVERDQGILTTRGFDFRYPYYLNFFIPMVEQLGGSLVDDEGKLAVVNEEAWEKAFSFMQEWGPLGKNLGSPTYINARSIFNDEKIAMMLSGLYQEARIRKENPEFYASGDWMIVPFPVFEGGKVVGAAKYCHYWCVNASASKAEQEAAWTFIGFLSSFGLDYLNEVGLLLPRKDIIEDISNFDIPYLDVFLSQMEVSSFVYSGPEVGKLISILEELMKEVMLSGLEPQKAVIRLKISLQEMHL